LRKVEKKETQWDNGIGKKKIRREIEDGGKKEETQGIRTME